MKRFNRAGFFKYWYIKLPLLAAILILSGFAFFAVTRHSSGNPPAQEDEVPTIHFTEPAATETDVLPAIKPTTRPVPEGQAAVVVSRVPIKEPAVFITIDDGWYPSPGVLELMQRYHLPLTAFLIQQAAEKHVSYWQEFVKCGGTIEDHTLSHPYLTRISTAQDMTQIASPIAYFKQFGQTPDELRPPYGDYDQAVEKIARAAGIKYIVTWNAVMANGKLSTYNGRPLSAGDIILMHWVPSLDHDLTRLLALLAKQGLGVASLTDALDGGPVYVSRAFMEKGAKAAAPPAGSSANGSVYKSVYKNVYKGND